MLIVFSLKASIKLASETLLFLGFLFSEIFPPNQESEVLDWHPFGWLEFIQGCIAVKFSKILFVFAVSLATAFV